MKSFFQNKIAVAVVLLLFGCVKSNDMDALVDEVLTEADGNAGEFETLLNRYDGYDKEIATYAIAAVWGRGARSGVGIDSIEALYRELPVRNSWQFDSAQLERGKRYMAMHLTRTKDAEVITAEYLEENIDDAIRLRDTRLWNKEIPKDIFCEMLLPYRLGDEPLSSWRLPYRTWLAELEDTLAKCNSSVEAAAIISRKIGTSPYNDRLSTPRRSALNLLEAPIGYCREDCDRTLYAMRSMGVPVATDMMLVSPDNGASHSWTVVWDNIDKRTRMFDNSAYTPTRDRIHYDKRRKGKVYRQTFLPDLARIRCYRNAQNPPPQLLNPHLKDVTAEYFGNNKAEMDLWRSDYSTIYLGVFAGKRFQPVDIAVKSGDKAIFTNIEPNLIFAPITSQGEICGYPFMITDSGKVESFVPDYDCRDTMSLTRKFPVRFHQKYRLESVVGLHVQNAVSPTGPWHDLEIIRSNGHFG